MTSFNADHLDAIQAILDDELMDIGVSSVLFIDLAGNIITTLDNGQTEIDVYALAALAAGNYGAVSTMAKILGEGEFTLLFHKGQNSNIHFNKVADDYLLIAIFGHEVSLGYLRLKMTETVERLADLIAGF
jgi:predicted regulator of Ras-like GTPase activity (Roadblock/LC7/MglB family)